MWALSRDPAWTTEGSTERRRCNCSWERSCLPLSRSELQDSDSRPVYCSPLFRKRKQRQAGKLLIILWKLILSLLFRSPQELPETMQVQLPDFLSSLERNIRELPILCLFPNPSNSQSSCNQRMSRLRDVSIPLSRRLTENWILVCKMFEDSQDKRYALLPLVSKTFYRKQRQPSQSEQVTQAGRRTAPEAQLPRVGGCHGNTIISGPSPALPENCSSLSLLFFSSWGKQFLTHQICRMWLSMYLEGFLWRLKQ